MTYPAPRRKSRTGLIVAVGLGALLLICCGLSALFGAYNRPAGNQQSQAAPSTASGFDRGAFDQYWSQFAGTSWGKQVTSIQPDDYGMTAKTALVGDVDAKQPSLSICGAVLNYWGTADDPPAVRVLDRAGAVLASRHTGESACSWRR